MFSGQNIILESGGAQGLHWLADAWGVEIHYRVEVPFAVGMRFRGIAVATARAEGIALAA